MKLNIDPKERGIEATRMKMPSWAGRAREMLPASSGTILDNASTLDEETLRIRGVNSRQVNSTFNPSGLMASGIFDDPVSSSYSSLKEWAQDRVPVEDEPDCADWMVPAQAQVALLKSRANEYDRAGSSLAVNAGDPFQPGVDNGQMAFKAERASDVENRGKAGIVMADGAEVELDVPGGDSIITSNTLGWGAGTNFQGKQWIGALMSVEELTNNPSQPIAFPTITDNTGPLFVGHEPSRPSIINRGSVTMQSNQAQTVEFKLRSSNDYTREIRSFTQDIPKGESTTTFRMLALGIEPMAMEINPQDGTQAVLTDYSVFP
jgi:hypothetical protein